MNSANTLSERGGFQVQVRMQPGGALSGGPSYAVGLYIGCLPTGQLASSQRTSEKNQKEQENVESPCFIFVEVKF